MAAVHGTDFTDMKRLGDWEYALSQLYESVSHISPLPEQENMTTLPHSLSRTAVEHLQIHQYHYARLIGTVSRKTINDILIIELQHLHGYMIRTPERIQRVLPLANPSRIL